MLARRSPLAVPSRGRAVLLVLAAVLAVVAMPGASTLHAQESENEPATYRLTDATFRRFSVATTELAALIRGDSAVAQAFSSDGVPPAVTRIFSAAGISKDEYVECFEATMEAMLAARVLEKDPSAGADIPDPVKMNASFLKKNKATFDRLVPDMRTIQQASSGS